MDLRHPSYQISEALRLIYRTGLTTTSGGNLSVKGDHGNIWITPAAVDKGSLSEKDIVKVLPLKGFTNLLQSCHFIKRYIKSDLTLEL